MREIILIFSYILCAFTPVLMIKRVRNDFSPGQFWSTWFVSLTGAFAGGVFGTMFLARIGLEFGVFASIVPALIAAWCICLLYLTLREMPGNW